MGVLLHRYDQIKSIALNTDGPIECALPAPSVQQIPERKTRSRYLISGKMIY